MIRRFVLSRVHRRILRTIRRNFEEIETDGAMFDIIFAILSTIRSGLGGLMRV